MRARGILLLVGLALVVAACADVVGGDPTSATTTPPADGPSDVTSDGDDLASPDDTTRPFAISAHQSDSGSGMDAIVSGIVEVDPELGCVWLSERDGTRHPAIWPVGTTAFINPFSLILADGTIIQEGDRVEGGGGYVTANPTAGGFDPFPEECIHTGEMAVFNAGTTLTVTPGEGLASDTLFTRFRPPAPIGMELIAVNPNQRSVAIVDFVTGTVHLYEPGDYPSPDDAIDGASGGGGFIHLWSDGTVLSYPGRITDEPLRYQPEPLRRADGIAPSLQVVPGTDGEHTWLVQTPLGEGGTLVELVNLVEVQVTRLGSWEIDGSWRASGATSAGLILESSEGGTAALVDREGTLVRTASGSVISTGFNGVVLLSSGGTVTITGPDLTGGATLRPPDGGAWTSIGDPAIPTDAPPLVTGGASYLVLRATLGEEATGGSVVVVEQNSLIAPVATTAEAVPLATWSRAEDWIVLVEASDVTLIPTDGGQPVPLGNLVPADHWVLSAG